MMRVSHNALFLNRVINDQSVFPHVSFKAVGPFDMGALVEDERNIFLANEHGGFLCVFKGDGKYEVHTQFLPDGRGASAIQSARDAMTYMFTQTDCTELETFVADEARGTRLFTLKAGFKEREAVELLDTAMHRFTLTKDAWEEKCQPQSH